jgi:hypothetical protein
VAAEFEPLVSDYMGRALHGQEATAARKAVEANLQQQRAKLAYVKPYLDDNGKASAQRFDDAAIQFILQSRKNPTGVQTGPMYQELEYLFGNSQDLIAASNRATGMENIKLTSGAFWKRTLTCSSS